MKIKYVLMDKGRMTSMYWSELHEKCVPSLEEASDWKTAEEAFSYRNERFFKTNSLVIAAIRCVGYSL